MSLSITRMLVLIEGVSRRVSSLCSFLQDSVVIATVRQRELQVNYVTSPIKSRPGGSSDNLNASQEVVEVQLHGQMVGLVACSNCRWQLTG
jgi:hypothetical protein